LLQSTPLLTAAPIAFVAEQMKYAAMQGV